VVCVRECSVLSLSYVVCGASIKRALRSRRPLARDDMNKLRYIVAFCDAPHDVTCDAALLLHH
jgi:hypothetical protein